MPPRDALEKALKDPNTPASEIARLTQNLKDAMNKDIQAMAENLRKQQQNGDKQPQQDQNAQTIDQHELNDQVDKMNQMAQAGSRDAAQDMLDYIKQLLENMKAGQSGKENEQGKKSLQDLKDLAKKQRDLENGNDPKAAEEQEALRKSLGDAARQNRRIDGRHTAVAERRRQGDARRHQGAAARHQGWCPGRPGRRRRQTGRGRRSRFPTSCRSRARPR